MHYHVLISPANFIWSKLNSIDVGLSVDHKTAPWPDMIQLTMKRASIYDARANDITIKWTETLKCLFFDMIKWEIIDFRMYLAPENMSLH